MKSNMGSTDKTIRIFAAIAIAVLYFAHQISGVTAIVLLAIAGIFIVTSFISFWPLYFPFGISTRSNKD